MKLLPSEVHQSCLELLATPALAVLAATSNFWGSRCRATLAERGHALCRIVFSEEELDFASLAATAVHKLFARACSCCRGARHTASAKRRLTERLAPGFGDAASQGLCGRFAWSHALRTLNSDLAEASCFALVLELRICGGSVWRSPLSFLLDLHRPGTYFTSPCICFPHRPAGRDSVYTAAERIPISAAAFGPMRALFKRAAHEPPGAPLSPEHGPGLQLRVWNRVSGELIVFSTDGGGGSEEEGKPLRATFSQPYTPPLLPEGGEMRVVESVHELCTGLVRPDDPELICARDHHAASQNPARADVASDSVWFRESLRLHIVLVITLAEDGLYVHGNASLRIDSFEARRVDHTYVGGLPQHFAAAFSSCARI